MRLQNVCARGLVTLVLAAGNSANAGGRPETAAPPAAPTWTGSFQPTQPRTAALAVAGKQTAFGTVTMAYAQGSLQRVHVVLGVAVPTNTASPYRWAVYPDRCGTVHYPLIGLEQFPLIDISTTGRGQIEADVPLALRSGSPYHVTVYSGGPQLENVVTCANLQYGVEPPMSVDRPYSAQVTQAAPSAAISLDEKEAIHKVIRDYYEAFGRDSAAASAFYAEPTVIVLPSDVIILGNRTDVESYLGKTVASLRPSGYSHSKLGDYHVTMLNATTALFSTVAIRIRADGTEMQRSGFTYLLRRKPAGWRIHGIIPTDLDKLIGAE